MSKSKVRKKTKDNTAKKQGVSKSKAKLPNLPSQKSIEAMMSDFFGGGGPSQPSALGRAQEIMYNAWEATPGALQWLAAQNLLVAVGK